MSVFYFGKWATIANAFLFIGLNITARDKLHENWKNDKLLLKMGLLILAGSAISYALNRGVARIAIASFIAFVITGIVDTVVYHLAIKKSRFTKINLSNVFSSLADSVVFPTIAFGVFMPVIVLGQFLAKVFGGFIWALILSNDKS
jgi:uncharacterized membrane protein